MSTTYQNSPKGWQIVLFYVAGLLLACLLLWSCATSEKAARKEAKKNEQAYQRVLTDSAMFRSIGQRFAKLQPPCVSDTIIGETEVLILSDTQYVGNTDTLKLSDTIRITTTKTNTVTKYVVDNRAIHELQDTIHALHLRAAAYSGNVAQLSTDRDKEATRANFEAKRAKRAGWLMWGILAAALVSHLFRSIPTIRKAIGI